ncbi:TPA: Shedu anti-phage system protein SduA domain-containing protein [Bacillus cereus]
MRLYQRDFMGITEEEKEKWEEVQKEELLNQEGPHRPNYAHMYPKAIRHYLSYFPNNYMDYSELKDKAARFTRLTEEYKKAIDNTKSKESNIKSFIKENEAYFIIASLLKDYDFGHHDVYLFPEFYLGNSFKADYLIAGRNSAGFHFVFVEMEGLYDKITLKDGTLGDTFRKGIRQINEWKRYLSTNYPTLEETFRKYKNPNLPLPNEFLKYESGRIHYVVVAGRRDDFTDQTYWERGEFKDNQKIAILHYDNLYDKAKATIGGNTY